VKRPPIFLAAGLAAWLAAPALAVQSDEGTPSKRAGLVPMPEDLSDRAHHLAGDPGGRRSALAEAGLQIEAIGTQVIQDVVSGGAARGGEFGGKLETFWKLDLDRMGALPGALVTMRTESRAGNSVNGTAGVVLPVNDVAFFPLTDENDEDVAAAVTELRYLQFLSKEFGLFLGKFTTLGGDANEFAGGRGDSQFLGHAFLASPVTALVNPYSTLGFGALWMPRAGLVVSSTFFSAADSSTSSGLDDLDEGWVWTGAVRSQYEWRGAPGGMTLTAQYGFDNDFVDFDGSFVGADGLQVPLTGDTWNLCWTGWQYLMVEPGSSETVDPTNGKTDRQGLGLFARAAVADASTNPVRSSVSAGLAMRGMLPGRDSDTAGLGISYADIRDEPLLTGSLLDSSARRAELYYSFAFSPSAQLTLDYQWVDSMLGRVEPAELLGLRLRLQF
jgi:porin